MHRPRCPLCRVVYTCVLEVNTKSDYIYQLVGKPHMFWYQTKVLAVSKES